MWFIGVEVEQETSAPPSKKNPGSAPAHVFLGCQSATLHANYMRKLYRRETCIIEKYTQNT